MGPSGVGGYTCCLKSANGRDFTNRAIIGIASWYWPSLSGDKLFREKSMFGGD